MNYQFLHQQLAALTHGVPHKIANLSNAAALLYHTLPDLNWAGFYLMENGLLVLTAGKDTIRMLPPLTISDRELEEGLAILKKTLEEA